MSEQSSQEPTMEEILASIRRIISEDETPAGEGAPEEAADEAEAIEDSSEPEVAAQPPEPEPEPEAVPQPVAAAAPESVDDDEELELTQKVETHGDLDFVPAPSEPAPVVTAPPPVESGPASLVSEHVAAAAAATFGRLSANLAMPPVDQTLDGVVREMLRPMLQQWLDDNLPAIVQQAVEAEVERISRTRVR
jgi:cell pole-organizing protein PopZ